MSRGASPGRLKRVSSLLNALDASSGPVASPQTSSPLCELVGSDEARAVVQLPDVAPSDADFRPETDLRRNVLHSLDVARSEARDLSQEYRTDLRTGAEKGLVMQAIQEVGWQKDALQEELTGAFVPQHSPLQLVSPQRLLMNRLFNVRPHKVPREDLIKLVLGTTPQGEVRYSGPELRQSDGLAFMALINMARDVRVGRQVSFLPKSVCEVLHGGYNGKSRELLREAIFRLQHAVLRFPGFSVQLAQRFEYPQHGAWSVALDPEIVSLFVESRVVWLNMDTRLALPEGLCSWLYGYIEGQTTLIPQSTERLREMCGSDADPQSFHVMLRRALGPLVARGLVDQGWSIKKGLLHWRKPPQVRLAA